jgi:hypothetical protein
LYFYGIAEGAMQEIDDLWAALSDSERDFVTAYLGPARFNAVAAAKAAGYSHPAHQSWRLRHRTDVAQVIEAELKNRAMGQGEILETLSQIARRPGASWFKVSSRGAVTLDMKAAQAAGLLDLAEGFDYNKQGKLVIKMPSRMEALTLLAKAQGMLKESGGGEGQQALSLLRDMLFGEEPTGDPVVGKVGDPVVGKVESDSSAVK